MGVSLGLEWRLDWTYVVSWVHGKVGLHVMLVRTPDSASHAGPGLSEGENTLNIVASDLLAGDWVNDGRIDAEEWEGGTARLGGGNTSERGDDVGADLGLPVGLILLAVAISVCISGKLTSITWHSFFPTVSWYHFHTSGAIGSPTVPRTRRVFIWAVMCWSSARLSSLRAVGAT